MFLLWKIPSKWEWNLHCDVSLWRVVPNFSDEHSRFLEMFGSNNSWWSEPSLKPDLHYPLTAHEVVKRTSDSKNNLSILSFENTGPTFVYMVQMIGP